MKFHGRYAVLVAALAAVGFGSVVAAQGSSSSASSSSPAMHRHWHGRRGSMLVRTLLRATRQLNLSTDQKQSIKTLLSQARTTQRSAGATMPDITVLGNPGHEEYSSAVQSLASNASGRIQRESELASSIYNVLSTQQKQQLPTVLANMKAQAQARRAAWQAQHASATTGSTN
jgi:Spy/CpxP family protein refolding chaperone